MMTVDAVVLDIEGTTTSVAFATEVLYPHARERLPNYVRRHRNEPEVAAIMDEARDAGGVWNDEAVVVRMCHWMERDQKVTPLKDLQELIWEEGYRNGELMTPLYADVAPAMRNWHARGLRLYIYSSGSVHAQRLIYGHTVAGDLTPLLSGYFDTRIGHKRAADSYRRIAEAIGVPPQRILFLSDVREELDAAREAEWQTVWMMRAGLAGPAAAHRRATRFDRIPL
ncbi:acireductone synthase [Thiocapsa sp. UBA6158]|jgi:enolase-phosphatase E1|uniref:acireductone synthase n=1 Tax=Thiocapsa sp. UBA6158 TaxID=1947692 RepID=UPI0025FAE1D2|nr:acireductone synthase [Thiocapsa sp. UBA6158]